YFPWISGLHILLDYFIDQAEDEAGGDLNFVSYYPDAGRCRERLLLFLKQALDRAAALPAPLFHTTVVRGLPAFYLSDPKVSAQGFNHTAGALLAVLVGLVYSSLITFTNGGANLDFITPTFVREQFETYGRTVFVLAPYVAMAFAGAVVGRSTLAGVGLSIGFAFMEPLIGGLMRLGGRPWEEIPRFFVNANAQVILLQNKLPEVLPHFGSTRSELAQQHLNSPEVAAIFLAVYTAIFIGLAFWVYRRRDITAA
ncbi:MAG: DUF2600 family protein, partial [Dehalococcoidia bacterium]